MAAGCHDPLSTLAHYMNRFVNILPLLVSLMVYVAAWLLMHPYLGYLLDSDGVAYLTIARRVNENFAQSVNGLWSPLNSWLIAPFIRRGFDAWMTAKVMNACFGGIVIILTDGLFRRFSFRRFAHWTGLLAVAILMVHHVYLQMFGDVLQMIFILVYLRLTWSEQFLHHRWLPLLCGLVMGIGFYAKSYTLWFFVLHFLVIHGWLLYRKKLLLRQAMYSVLAGTGMALLTVLPWTILLHQKYQRWTISGMAGNLNMSWNINSGKTFAPGINLLIPPTYSDSPSFWEDPVPSQGALSSPFSSGKHFFRWGARVVHTCLAAVNCFNEISCFAIAILLLSVYLFVIRKRPGEESGTDDKLPLLVLTILVLPAGYLMMHIETRYIWTNGLLLLLAGVALLDQTVSLIPKYVYRIAIMALSFSFIVFPVLDSENLRYKNRELFEIAENLKAHNLRGSFTSNATDAGRMWVIAYLGGMSFYTIERSDYSMAELIGEMKRYGVDYYLYQSENNCFPVELGSGLFEPVFKGPNTDFFRFIHEPVRE